MRELSFFENLANTRTKIDFRTFFPNISHSALANDETCMAWLIKIISTSYSNQNNLTICIN